MPEKYFLETYHNVLLLCYAIYFLCNFSSPSKFLTSVFALGTLHEFCKSFTEMETVPNLGPFIWLQQIPLSSSFTEVNYFATRVNFQQRKAVKIVNSLAFRKRLLFCQCHLYWCLRPSKMTMTIKNACAKSHYNFWSGEKLCLIFVPPPCCCWILDIRVGEKVERVTFSTDRKSMWMFSILVMDEKIMTTLRKKHYGY